MNKIVFLFGLALYGACAFPSDTIADENQKTSFLEASHGQFPFMASLQKLQDLVPSRAHVCGGVLISLQHVLTAASCLFQASAGSLFPIEANAYKVFAGERNLNNFLDPNRIRTIANFTAHPDFQSSPIHLNDIGIITLTSPFIGTNRLRALPLPSHLHRPQESSSSCTVSGWGALEFGGNANPSLKYTTKALLTQTECETQYPLLSAHPDVQSSMVCAAPTAELTSGCTGDNGNPLVCNDNLVGILFISNRCGVSTDPELYTRVSNYTTWIEEVTGLSSSSTMESSAAFVFVVAVAQIVTSKFYY